MKSNEKEKIFDGDKILSKKEQSFLKENKGDGVKKIGDFFGVRDLLKNLENAETPEEMTKILGNNSEKIALIQAYIFENPEEIDGKIGKRTFDKIKNELNKYKNQEINDKKKGYTLSQNDFEKYFSGNDFKQMNIGNCYILSVIDGMSKLDFYEDLIRKNVKFENGIFEIKLPLGDKNGKVFKINKKNYNSEIGLDGKYKYLAYGKPGIIALCLAYGELTTGKKDFSVFSLSGGHMDKTYNSLIFGINSYSQFRRKINTNEIVSSQKNISGTKKKIYSGLNKVIDKTIDSDFEKNLKNILENFNPKKQVLTIAVNQLNGYDKVGNWYDYSGFLHAINVEKVFEKNGKMFIELSNPWDASKSYILSFDELKNKIRNYYLGSFKQVDFLKGKENTEKDNRKIYLGNSKGTSLDSLIQNTGKIDSNLISERGNVKVEKKGDLLYVNSYGIKFNLRLEENLKFSYNGKNLELGLENFLGKENSKDKIFYNYSPRLATFFSRMLSQYLKNNKVKNPFSLDKNGNLIYSGDIKNPDNLRKIANIFGDNSVNILKNWENFGIKNNDQNTKIKIVNYLNSFS